jgi:hypothetical protein
MKFQPHPYHLVEPSPWPLAASIALLTSTVSAVCLFHGYSHGGVILTMGLLAVLSTMGLWWADVIREGTFINLEVPSLNLTVCWKLLRAFGPLSYHFKLFGTIQGIGQSAGNQRGFKLESLSRILRDYTLSVGRFMHSQSGNDMYFDSINLGAYLAGLWKKMYQENDVILVAKVLLSILLNYP